MIKTVLFDLGNVIMPYDFMRLAIKLAKFSPFSGTEILEKMGSNELVEKFESGKMTPAEYFATITRLCQFKDLSFEQFSTLFNDIFEVDADVLTLISGLKKRYKLGLISNANPIHVDYIRRNYATLVHFDKLWFSNEAGVRKPSDTIYRMALDYFSNQPEETVFIDDMSLNVEAAKALGMNAIHYKNAESLIEELNELGVRS